MDKESKYSRTQVVSFTLCLIGCALLAVQVFVDTEFDLLTTALAFNGVGLLLFVFSRKS